MLKKKFGWLILFFLLLGLACQLNPVSPGEEAAGFRRFFVTATPAPTPPPEDLTPYYQTMKPDHVGDIDQVLAQKVTRYWIELLVTPDSLTPPAAPELIGSMRVQYTNREPVLINQVYFRLFPNTPSYEGSMTVNNVIVDNQPVQTTLVADGSALFVPLHRALNTGESTEIVMTYRATVPVTTGPGNGLFTYDQNILSLAGFYPTIPVFDESGWHLDVAPTFADATYTDVSLYDVKLRVPADMVVAASGKVIEAQSQNDGTNQLHIISGPMRDFFISMSPTYEQLTREVEGVLITSYFPAGYPESGMLALDVAANSISTYSRLFGPYPYREFDIAAAPMPDTLGGMEYPGIVAMAHRYYEADNTFMEFITAHEVAHQWWYGLIGSDQLNTPWLDEALAQYSTVHYYEDHYDPSRRQEIIDEMFSAPYQLFRNISGDRPVVGTAGSFGEVAYLPIVYGKGPLFYEAVRNRLGDEAYFAALQRYVAEHRYGLTRAEDLLAAFDQAGQGDVTDLYQQWISGQ